MADSSRLSGGATEESLDELALSALQLPPSSPRRGKTPLAAKSPNVRTQYLDFDAAPTFRGTSPSKSMFLETPAKPGSSPWRIKVTVQAEPNSDAPISDTPSKPSARAPRSRKTIVPLKDADSPVKRGRGRPRKSEVTPAPSAIKKRKGTPMRRRSARLSSDTFELKGEAGGVAEKPAPKPRGRPRKSLANVALPAESASPRNERQPSAENAETENILPPSPVPADQQTLDSPGAQGNPVELEEEAALLSPPAGRLPTPSRALTPPENHPETQATISRLSSHPYVYNFSPAKTALAENRGAIAKEVPAGARTSGFPSTFADLTPLHKKYPLTKPSPDKFAPVFSRLKESGVVPVGWSRPVFSPIPARQLATPGHRIARGSRLITTGSPRSLEAQVIADVVPVERSSPERSTHPAPKSLEEGQQTEEQAVEEQDEGERPEEERVEEVSSDYDNGEPQATDQDDAEMWRHMVHTREDRDDVSTQGAATSGGDDSDESDFGDGGMEFTGHPIGEQTMMQSEEFSMVSLDSLRELQSSFVDNSHIEEEHTRPAKSASKLNQSWKSEVTPDQTRPSPRYSSHSKHTPLAKATSSSLPSAPNSSRIRKSSSKAQSSPAQPRESVNQFRANRFSSPKIARIAQASNTLQDALSSPVQGSSRRSSMHEERLTSFPTRSSVFLSSPPNASTHSGSNAKLQASHMKPPTSTLLLSEARLPTPNSLEREPHEFGEPVAEAEQPELRFPPPGSASKSPAKSDGGVSWQTQTPPSTRRGTPSTNVEDGADEEMRDQPSSLHKRTPSARKVIEKEAEWQRAREEVSRTIQSAKASSVIVIESDKESDNENEEEDDSDLWQEEASREEPSQLGHSRSTLSANRSKLFSPVELNDEPRPHKVSRTWRRTSATDSSALDNTRHDEGQARSPIVDERSRHAAHSAEISALFKSLGDGRHYHEPTSSPKHAQFSEPATLDQSPRESRYHRHSSAMAPSPAKGILKRRLSFGTSQLQTRGDEQDYSEAQNTSFNTTFTDANVSMASDVRQIRYELKASRNFANQKPAKAETLKVATKLRSVDDSIEEEQEHLETSTMLSITPKHTPKPLFPDARAVKSREQKAQVKDGAITRKVTAQPPVHASTAATKATKEPAVAAPSLLTRVWSYLPFGYAPPPRPTHPMLDKLPLLPRVEPWTRTHYLTMLRLYERYLRHPALFSPSHPANASLLTPAFTPYIDIEILRWGYHLKLNTSHIIIASLFTQLLVLKDADEYERVEGEAIDVGECLPGRTGEVINEWKCVRRLFSVVTGKTLRRDEAEGKAIDRTGHMKWRFAGEEEWVVWRKRVFGSMSDGRGCPADMIYDRP